MTSLVFPESVPNSAPFPSITMKPNLLSSARSAVKAWYKQQTHLANSTVQSISVSSYAGMVCSFVSSSAKTVIFSYIYVRRVLTKRVACQQKCLVIPLERIYIKLSNGATFTDLSHTQSKLLDAEHAWGRKSPFDAFEINSHVMSVVEIYPVVYWNNYNIIRVFRKVF